MRTSIRALHQHFQRSLQRQVERIGFTLPQMRVIQEAVAHPGLTIGEMAGNLGMTQSTVSDIVNRLVARGIIIRRPHPADRRSVQLWPAPEVAAFMSHDRSEFVNRSVAGVVQGMSAEQQDMVLAALRLLLEGVKSAQGTESS